MTPPMHVTTKPTHALLMALAAHGALSNAALTTQLCAWGYATQTTAITIDLLRPLRRRGLVTATGTRAHRLYMLGAMAPAWAWQLMQIGKTRETT